MSLSECFERIGPDVWADASDIQKFLIPSKDTSVTPKASAIESMRRFLGVLSGRINLYSICEHYLSEGDIGKAFQISRDLSENGRLSFTKNIAQKMAAIRQEGKSRTDVLERRIKALGVRKVPDAEKDLLGEFQEKSILLSRHTLSSEINLSNLQAYEDYLKQVMELEEWISLLESEITAYEKDVLKKGFNLFQAILVRIRVFLEDPASEQRKVLENCFSQLPHLVLTGSMDALRTIHESLKTGNLDKLAIIDFPQLIPLSSNKLSEFRRVSRIGLQSPKAHAPISMRTATEEHWKSVHVLNEDLDSADAVRVLIEKKIRKARTLHEAALLLLGGSKKILSMGEENVLDLQARGFLELAEYELIRRRYTFAFDLFADSFSFFVSSGENNGPITFMEKKAATGMILADWAPRKITTQKGLEISEIISSVFEEPKLMLNNIVEKQKLDILFHSFDALNERIILRSFIDFLEESVPAINWRSILLDRVMQPRLFFRNPLKGIMQLRALLEGKDPNAPVDKAVETLANVVEASLDNVAFGKDISELEEHKHAIDKLLKESKVADFAILERFSEGISLITESLRDKIPPAKEIQFTLRPVSTTFFIEERCENLELILLLTASESSLPIKFLTAEARIQEKQKGKFEKFVSFRNQRIPVGPIDPNSVIEFFFVMNINPKILEEYSSIPIEFNFLDESTVINTMDKKQVFNISLRQSRKGTRQNPFIAGPAIEPGGLYVGREKELDSIKKTLVGQSQDNIPLVLGIRRIGKTSLLKRLISDFEIKRRYITVFYDLQDMPESETTKDFLKKLCSRIHDSCGKKWGIYFSRDTFDEDPFEAFDRYTMSFQTVSTTKRVLIIFDEFEKMVSNITKWQRRIEDATSVPKPQEALLPEVFGALRKVMLHSQRFSFIISGVPKIKSSFEEYQARWFALMSPLYIKPLEPEDAKNLMQPEGIPYKYSSEAVNEILFMTGYQPYLIQLVGKNIFTDMLLSGRDTVARKDVEDVIEKEILPNESYFINYYDLMGEDTDILTAIALCHKKVGKRRRYVTINEISESLANLGSPKSKGVISERLKEMERADRPLVQRSPSRTDAYRIVIGILSRFLEDRGL